MDLSSLTTEIHNLDTTLVQRAASAVNISLTARNWLIGAYLVEFEQKGRDRAQYGEKLIPELAKRLKELGIKGLGTPNIQRCRQFYLMYPEIHATLSHELPKLLSASTLQNSATLSHFLEASQEEASLPIRPTAGEPTPSALPRARGRDIITQLSFSHLVELFKIDDPLKRSFYEIEAIKGRWSVRDLKRQIGSLLFERTGLSKDKKKLLEIANGQIPSYQPRDLIRDPYIFEFLGLNPRETVEECDLETALLDHLQTFLTQQQSSS